VSRIYFSFDDGDSMEILGPERAHFGITMEEFAKGMLGLVPSYGYGTSLIDRLDPFINPDHPLANTPPRTAEWDRLLSTSLNSFVRGREVFAWKGRPLSSVDLTANTVLAAGSDPLRLAVKIHLLCEVHGYVMGYHRGWLADLIEEGYEEGLYRKGFRRADPEHAMDELIGKEVAPEHMIVQSMGWPELVAKLREGRSGPVVMSYSVTEGFPNSSVANWLPPWPKGVEKDWNALSEDQQKERHDRQEEWLNLPYHRHWDLAVKGLKGRQPPIEPKNLRTLRFGHEISLIDLLNGDIERIKKGLKIT